MLSKAKTMSLAFIRPTLCRAINKKKVDFVDKENVPALLSHTVKNNHLKNEKEIETKFQ
jgi:hypothetical protein